MVFIYNILLFLRNFWFRKVWKNDWKQNTIQSYLSDFECFFCIVNWIFHNSLTKTKQSGHFKKFMKFFSKMSEVFHFHTRSLTIHYWLIHSYQNWIVAYFILPALEPAICSRLINKIVNYLIVSKTKITKQQQKRFIWQQIPTFIQSLLFLYDQK